MWKHAHATHAKGFLLSTKTPTGKGMRKRTHFDVQPLYSMYIIPCTPLCLFLEHEPPDLDHLRLARALIREFLACLELGD